MRRRPLIIVAAPGLTIWVLGGSWAFIDRLRPRLASARRALWI